MTTRLSWQDPYMKEFDAMVVDVQDNKAILDRTAFYAESGGQLGDTGTLNGIKVLDTRYNEDKTIIFHVIGDPSTFKKGGRVHGVIDWCRRYKMMQHHSAIHIMYDVFTKLYGKQKVIGSQVRDDSSRMDFEFFD